MANLFRTSKAYKWIPDSDAVNAEPGTLLRADNTVPDEIGARNLRKGSTSLYSGLQDARAHSLYTPTLQGTVTRLAGIDDQAYHDGIRFGSAFDSSGDIAFGDDAYQAFMARGSTKKKFDKTNFYNWGIAAPEQAPTLIAVPAIQSTIATFDSTESPAFVINEAETSAFVANYAGTANAALSLQPKSGTGRASCSKTFASDQDMLNILTVAGGPTDIFDFRVWLEEPRKVDTIRIMFGLGTGADPFLDDYFYFDFNINQGNPVDIKDVASSVASTYNILNTKVLSALSPSDITEIKTPEEAAAIIKKIGSQTGSVSGGRADSQQNSPAWGHLSVTRGQFQRVGGTAGRNWMTVRGFKVVYSATPGSTEHVYLDDAVWSGGGSRALTGTYKVGYRFARQFRDAGSNQLYVELSPMSPISSEIVLNQQALQVTVPATSLSGKDPQVDQVWIYLYGGWLDTYYRVLIASSTVRSGMTIDELTNPTGTNFSSPEKRTRLSTHGFTISPGAGAANASLVASISKSETEAMVDGVIYEPGCVGPPNNIIAIAGPWKGRMFALTSEGWLYPSTTKSPSHFSLYHTLDLRRYGTPYWLVGTRNGIFAGFSDDIVFIAGSGSEDSNHITVDLFGSPLSVANPPVDKAVAVDGDSIIYRSADGLMQFSGASFSPVPFNGTKLLWEGKARHGLSALNITSGRFRIEVDNHDLYLLVSEGPATDPTALWKFNSQFQQWSRFTYPATLLSLHREPDGVLLAGTAENSIIKLEIDQGTDSGTPIAVDVLSPIDDGDSPLARKAPADLQIHINTGGGSGMFSILLDGGAAPSATVPFSTIGPSIFRSALNTLAKFTKMQVEITGAFQTFQLHAFGVTYRPLPQQVMALDLGYVIPPDGGRFAWLLEAQIDCISPVDLSLQVFKDDVLHATLPVVVTPGVRTIYRNTMPRETKARRLRLVYLTTNGASQGDVGFEPYMVRLFHRGHGNVTEIPVGQGDQGSI